MIQYKKYANFLLNFEIFVQTIAVAAGFVIPRLLPVAAGLGILFIFLRWASHGFLSLPTPADLPVLLLLLLLPVTLWATAFPDTTYPQVFRLLSGIALFYAVVNWLSSSSKLRLSILAVAGLGFFLSAYSVIGVNWVTGKIPFIPPALYTAFPQLVSDSVHRNVMAGSLVILFPVISAYVLFGWGELPWVDRIILLFSFAATGTLLILTQSRGAVVALFAVFLLLAFLRWRWGWVISLGLLSMGLIFLQRYGFSSLLDSAVSADTVGTLTQRTEIWSRAIYMIQDFPITGVGMGSFGPVADTLYPFFTIPPDTIPHAHNLFLQIAVDLGIPGLIAWLAILFTVISAAWQVYAKGRQSGSKIAQGLGAGLLASQIALMTHGMVDAVTWGMVKPAPIVWGLWGLTIAGWNLYKDKDALGIHEPPLPG